MIPVSVLVMTRNEAPRIARCLAALKDFAEVVVVDSHSADATPDIAWQYGATVHNFSWDGRYPKKRQWCLDNLPLRHDWVFFIDADEEATSALVNEIRALFAAGPRAAGYFVRGRYEIEGRVLRFGLANNKLALFDRRRLGFPAVDDLDLPGMGEIEGHYQPVVFNAASKIGRLRAPLIHRAYDADWEARHRRYAAWEAGMNERDVWPRDPVPAREKLKRIFRGLPARGAVAFAHSYVLKGGFLDGRRGFRLARDRWRYYRMIAAAASKAPAPDAAAA